MDNSLELPSFRSSNLKLSTMNMMRKEKGAESLEDWRKVGEDFGSSGTLTSQRSSGIEVAGK
jgi:hypothetical protein